MWYTPTAVIKQLCIKYVNTNDIQKETSGAAGCSGCEAAAVFGSALTDASEDSVCDGLDKQTSLFLHFSLKCKRKPHFEDCSLLAMTVQWYFITTRHSLVMHKSKPVYPTVLESYYEQEN